MFHVEHRPFNLSNMPEIIYFLISPGSNFVNYSFLLAPLHFCDSFSCGKASLWTGCKGVTHKKHRRENHSPRRSSRASARGGGPIGRPAGRPYIGITLLLRQGWLARPPQRTRRASWFLRVTPLLPGPATPEIQFIFRLLGEK